MKKNWFTRRLDRIPLERLRRDAMRMNVLDKVTTFVGVGFLGMKETNPFMIGPMKELAFPWWLSVLAVCVVSLCGAMLVIETFYHAKKLSTTNKRWLLLILFSMFGAVSFSNLALILGRLSVMVFS